MPTSYAWERNYIGQLVAGAWADRCPINWPNDELAEFPLDGEERHVLPAPTSDRTNPAHWLSIEFDYTAATRASFSGDVQVDGVVMIGIHVQLGAGDGKLREILDTLTEIFRADGADGNGIQFLEPQPELPEYVDDDWYKRQLSVPFTRFRDL